MVVIEAFKLLVDFWETSGEDCSVDVDACELAFAHAAAALEGSGNEREAAAAGGRVYGFAEPGGRIVAEAIECLLEDCVRDPHGITGGQGRELS